MITLGGARRASPCLAIDIGATKVEVAIVAPDGTISSRSRLVVAQHQADLFGALVELARRVRGDQAIELFGVGCAGPMTKGGDTVSPLNIPPWRDFPLRDSLRDAFHADVYVDGDARALALAEGVFGAAQDVTSYLSMVVSTGVGGGLVLNGRLLDGDTGNAGHVGHLNVVANGALCSCGAYGCLEAEASGWAIEERTGRPADQADQATRQRTGELVGRAVGMLSSVLDFRHCFVAGSVALGYGDEFFAEANKSARTTAMMSYSHDVEIRRSQLGADGPLLGAALVGWRGAP
ncbi:MAG TPA: ROK family protein [Acidimicrobiales bacterium]|nr:ROK family protein [Acidimicrobiales bacterium]